MPFIVVGIFPSYGAAERTVQDLEHAGIVGEQVELISDIDEDARTANTPGERSTNPPGSHQGKLARLFAHLHKPAPDVRDEPGQMPDYIGEQEFYTSHVKSGGAILVIRVPAEQTANQAAGILESHGARNPGQKSGPVVRRMDQAPGSFRASS
jgi:hypothetical protein